MSKIKRKENVCRFLTASNGTKPFMKVNLVHGWTEPWCRYLDYIANIDISHHASPGQRARYAGLYHLRCGSDNFIMKTMKARPDYQMATSAMRSVDQEAGVKPQLMLKSNSARDDFDPRKRNWLTWLSHILGNLLRRRSTYSKLEFH